MADRPDVIVVLGAALLPGGRASRALARRVRHAARLFHQGRARYLLVTGGATAGAAATEALAMRDLALAYGVPAERVVVEDRAHNTVENAAYCGRIMAARGWRRALIVTDAFHLPRALFLFRLMRIPASGDAVRDRRDEPAWRWYGAYAREAVAFVKSLLLCLGGRHKHVAHLASRR